MLDDLLHEFDMFLKGVHMYEFLSFESFLEFRNSVKHGRNGALFTFPGALELTVTPKIKMLPNKYGLLTPAVEAYGERQFGKNAVMYTSGNIRDHNSTYSQGVSLNPIFVNSTIIPRMNQISYMDDLVMSFSGIQILYVAETEHDKDQFIVQGVLEHDGPGRPFFQMPVFSMPQFEGLKLLQY